MLIQSCFLLHLVLHHFVRYFTSHQFFFCVTICDLRRCVHTKDDQLGWMSTSTLVQLFAFKNMWNQLKLRKNLRAEWRRMMQLSPHYSSSFDETDMKSTKDEWLTEVDWLRSASIRLIIFTSTLHSAQADHPSWINWSSSCGRTLMPLSFCFQLL